ncbi:MAG: phosphoglycerate kinase [Pseudomonadota bacterium]|nr:MAG: phosphoglycerate kinase [Pseudomonadota bacterium]
MSTFDGLRTLEELPIEGRRTFVRADLDVPLERGRIVDETRLRAAVPTLKRVLERGGRLIVGTELGRPKGRVRTELGLEPVGARLSELLGTDVYLPDEALGDAARKIVQDLRPGQLCLLENLGFEPGEAENDSAVAARLAALTDVYVNDAFAASHRRTSSIDALPRLVHERGMGLAFEAELRALDRLRTAPERPYLGVLGGGRAREALELFESLLGRCTTLACGGVLANTLLAARGHALKATRLDADLLARARAALERARDLRTEVLLPSDVVVAESESAPTGFAVSVGAVPDGHMVLDVGETTVRRFAEAAARARTVLFAGELGAAHREPFASGTLAFARALCTTEAFRVVLDERLASLLERRDETLLDRIGHVSSGGRASLEFIEGRPLAGLEALRVGAS